ncbi:hypothetical protein TVAG_336700 [Trichomonas vaginalis G3]|uniref:Uncharacterized protein n=1 Tax=Trichomonas vaginalis (strain ATCC PRA-98 / G3) TaxID=412133 RepID=A2FLX4_TRIV3|nr:hypothetical protein TVAG_336700 [Trichomonas vaginalis G3]|eukprot:XP_001307037.1 hypothetical protein [Trichomonas vaginalis G3]
MTYDTSGILPTKITFAVIVDDVMFLHKTVDIVILQDPQIESITDSSSSHQYKTNSRITLNIKRIKANAIEDYSFKYEFGNRNANMRWSQMNELDKPIKVVNTENDFTLQFKIPNNVEAGEKDLLLKLVNPLNKESPVFRISLTIIKGREVNCNSIQCQATENIMLDNMEYKFKCYIDSIRSDPATYKAKVGNYDSKMRSEQFNIDVRVEPIGTENEYNAFLKIPAQSQEKYAIFFAMIFDASTFTYYDINGITIIRGPWISFGGGIFEINNILEFPFYVNYFYDFQTMKEV